MYYGEKHIFVSGQTGSGKTYWAMRFMEGFHGGVLFINSQHERGLHTFYETDREVSMELIIKALVRGYKLDYRPSEQIEIANMEVDLLIDNVMSSNWGHNLLFVIDEIADYAPLNETASKTLYLARRGRGKGIQAVFITQTPADVSKTITKQCGIHVFFKYNFYDEAYFERFKFDSDRIKKYLNEAPKHSYIVLDSDGIKTYPPCKKSQNML